MTEQDIAAIKELAERTRHWGLDQERPNDVLLEDGSGRLILRGFHAPKGSWSGWPPPWYARDAVELAKAVRVLLALLADTPSVEPAGLDWRLYRDAHAATVTRMRDRSISPDQHWPIFAEEVARLLPTQASDSPEKPT